MKIAFLSANQEVMPDACIPLGLLYLMGTCPDEHEKVLWDLCFEEHPQAYLAARLREFGPDVVAFGMRNIQNNDYSGILDNVAYYRAVMGTIRDHGDVKVVMGGGGFSVMPAELMQWFRPDFGISGEGEEAFPQLVTALAAGATDFRGIGALYYWDGDELRHNERPGRFLNMNELPIPDRTLVDPRYYELFGIDSIQTKRGCPLKCDYCTYPAIEGRVGRVRDPARVVDEMFRIREDHPGVRHVFVVDSVFNLPVRHAKAVCREMIARECRIPWTCYANPIAFDEELAGLMAQAGCVGMEIGSDSGCDDVLDRLKKGFDTSKIRAMREISAAAGLKDCHTFILGTEGETLEHVHRTLDFIVDLDPYAAIVMVWIDDYEALDPAYRRQRMELRDTIHDILRERRRQYPRWIIPPLGVHFKQELFAYLRRVGFHGPLWQHIHLAA